jgi:hypothetical protein
MIGKGRGPRGPPRYHGGGRYAGVRAQTPRTPAKKAPEGLLMLNANGDNVISWKNNLASHCEMKYGTISDFIRNNAYPTREVQTEDKLNVRFPGISAETITKMLAENMTHVMKQEAKDAESKFELFAIIESTVTEEGWNRVKSRSGFSVALNEKCPLKLLSLVTMEHSLKMNSVTDDEAQYIAEDRYHKVSMGPTRTLAEYYDVFDMCVNNMKTLKCDGIPNEKRLARHFLMKLDAVRYGGFMRDTINGDRNKTKPMPLTRQEIVDGARMHIPAQMMKAETVTEKQSMPMVYKLTEEQLQHPCHKCKRYGHWARECTADPPKADDNKAKSADKNEEKHVHHVTESVKEEEQDIDEQDEWYSDADGNSMFGYVFNAANGSKPLKLHQREVALDCFANVHFICNEDLLSDIKESSMVVKGFNESKTISKVGNLAGFGEAVLAPWSGVNGLALCLVEDKYTVTYYQQDRIEVEVNEDFIMKFMYKTEIGCYACMFDDDVIAKLKENATRFKYCNITLASEREKEHTTKEVIAARKARTMMRRLFYPADSTLVRTITKGAMVECNTTGKDVVLATDIYGRDVASMKGKTKDRKPDTYKSLLVPTMSQKEQTVYADVFHWREVNFVLFIVKPLRLVLVQWLPKLDGMNIKSAVLTLCTKVEARGYKICEVVVDPAKALSALVGVTAKNITVVGSRMHVADAEVEIRTIKERVRSSTHGLPYDTPRRLVRWQVYGAVMTYNMILRQGQTVSSRELFTGVKTNYNRDVRAEFGEYVQAHVSPGDVKKRGPEERTVGAIALCSADNQRGTHWFMSLKNNSYFRADRWTPLPITDDVIALMNKIHDDDQPKKVDMAVRRRKRRMRINASNNEDRDLTRELIDLPTERENPHYALPPATDVAEPEQDDILAGPPVVEQVSENNKPNANGEVSHRDVNEHEDGSSSNIDEMDDETSAGLENDTEQEDQSDVISMNEDENIVEDEDIISADPTEDNMKHSTLDNTIVGEDTTDDIGMEDPYDNFEHIIDEGDNQDVQLGSTEAIDGVRGTRKSHRISNKRKTEAKILHAYRLTVKKALKNNKKASKESIMKELKQIVDKEVWEVVDKAQLTKKQLKKVIRSSMFLTEKFTASGAFDKLKARLVAGGDGQDKSLYDNLSSPTVAHETVMMVLAIASIERRHVATIDISGAYLECEFDDDDEVIMTLDPLLATLLAQIDPTVKTKKDEKGVVYVKLKKALYGCIQSAKLWYDKLCRVLKACGYTRNEYDRCLFNKVVDGVQCTVAFHVDDLLITSAAQAMIDGLELMLKQNFSAITINKGKTHSYLAMNMVVTDNGIELDMIAYIKKVLEGRNIGRKTYSPAKDDLFEVSEDEELTLLDDERKKDFHSDVAKLLYLAKRTRGQILTAVSHLSGRVNAPTVDDQEKLDRVLAYLSTTIDEVMHFRADGEVDPEVYVDASYGVHADGSSRTGMVIMLGGVAIGCWSSKQKLVTKSSTEAEIVALSDGLTNAIWMREMIIAQGYKLGPTKIFEDNQGVIKIIKSGRSPKHRTRHLNIRHFFARDRENIGDIALLYKPTNEMIADIMTKPLTGKTFTKLGDNLVGKVEEEIERDPK